MSFLDELISETLHLHKGLQYLLLDKIEKQD